jgi:hypothetical protein
MIRRVAFKKAIFAGASGALAWELFARVTMLAGFRFFDLVNVLGTLALGQGTSPAFWWPVGLFMHLIVGAIWAIFYAYFFWSTFDIPSYFQGMVFSVLPALLAGLIMVPQMDNMIDGQMAPFGVFAYRIGWAGPTAIVAGHLIYGAIMGAIYVRPVGYAVGTGTVIYG